MRLSPNYLRAEWIRAKGSTLWWLALAGLLLGGLLAAFALVGKVTSARDMLGAQGLLLTGMAAPAAALFAGLAEVRERNTRSGGTLWRPVSPRSVRAARLVVVWAALLVFVALDFGVTWLTAVAFGLDNAGVVARVGLFAWIGTLGVAGLAAALTRRIELLPTLAVAAVWQIGLGYFVERDWWWLNPAAWPLRLVLPTLGTHFNLLPLDPDSPMYGESPWLALALCALLALIGFALAVVVPPRTRRVRSRRERARRGAHVVDAPTATTSPVTPRPTSPGFSAALRGVHRAAAPPAVFVAVVLTVLVLLFAMRYPTYVRHALFTYALLPVGAGVLPTLVWPRLRPAWALMQIEHPLVREALTLWFVLVVALVAVIASATSGASPIDELPHLILTLLTGSALVLLSLAITASAGVAWALGATILVTVLSATIGGDVLAETWLWILAFPAWPETATSPARFTAAAIFGAFLLVSAWQLDRTRLRGARPTRR